MEARIRLEFQPSLLPPGDARPARGCFPAKVRLICGARAGWYQTPRAWNSPSNCIAWRHTNDCIFGSRHRVHRKTCARTAIRQPLSSTRAFARPPRSLFELLFFEEPRARRIGKLGIVGARRLRGSHSCLLGVNENVHPLSLNETKVELVPHCIVIIPVVQSRCVN